MTTFEDRQRDLFNQLNAAEKQANFAKTSRVDPRNDRAANSRREMRQVRSEMKQFRGKESIFKRPEAPLSHCLRPRMTPGYQRNPKKWICYDLGNVGDMTERSNAEAAAACLREINSVKAITEEASDTVDNSKIVFKLPILTESEASKSEKKCVLYKNSVVIYPEHVVGQKSRQTNKSKSTKDKNTNNVKSVLKLDHLMDDFEDE